VEITFQILTSRPGPGVEAIWNACLDSAEFASYYVSPAIFYDPIFAATNPFAILAVAGSEIRGVLTGIYQNGNIRCFPTTCPEPEADRALALGLLSFAAKKAHLITVYSWTPPLGFAEAKFRSRRITLPLATILLDLGKGTETLFKELSETRRKQIRRALKAQVVVEELRVEDFDQYYQLYTDWCRFKGLVARPYEYERSYLTERANRLVLAARHQGKLVGVSIFRFRQPGIMESAANVSRREDTGLYQNDLLYWKAIEWAASRKLRYFSTTGSHFFLQRFGGTLKETYEYKRDMTLLRRHLLSDIVGDMALSAYKRMPESIKAPAKTLFRRRSEAE
jgi:hypothetical protein